MSSRRPVLLPDCHTLCAQLRSAGDSLRLAEDGLCEALLRMGELLAVRRPERWAEANRREVRVCVGAMIRHAQGALESAYLAEALLK